MNRWIPFVGALLFAFVVAAGCSSSSGPPACCYSAKDAGGFFCACGSTQGSPSCNVETNGTSCTIVCTGPSSTYSGHVVTSCAAGAQDGG